MFAFLKKLFDPPVMQVHHGRRGSFPVVNGRVILPHMMDELMHHHTMGHYYRERMEAAAAECCHVLGIDPERESMQRDMASDIVFSGMDPVLVVDQIEVICGDCES